MVDQALFSHAKNDWRTPPEVFGPLEAEFKFTVDGAANSLNHLLPRWWGPGSNVEDALAADWGGERIFINPEYSNIAAFLKKGYEARSWALSVFLIPSRTDTRYWHNYVWDRSRHTWQAGVQGRFLKGRVKFLGDDGLPVGVAPFPSVVIVMGGS